MDKNINAGFPFQWEQEIRFIGGKYNGYNGVVRLCGESSAQVIIRVANEPFEVIESTKFMQDFKEWKASKSATELALLPS